MPRPADLPEWTDGAPEKVVEPSGAKKLLGWIKGERPPFQYMNWFFYEVTLWIAWLDEVTSTTLFLTRKYPLADGQAETQLPDETFDAVDISSVEYFYECRRGADPTEVVANGNFSFQFKNAAWQVVMGDAKGDEVQIEIDCDQAGTVGVVTVAATAGPGDGFLKLKRTQFEVNP